MEESQKVREALMAGFDSATQSTPTDVWIDVDELPAALRVVDSVRESKNYRPEIYGHREDTPRADERVCLRL